MSFAEEFATKTTLPAAFQVELGETPSRDKYLILDHPAALARFVAFVKSRLVQHGAEVYLRGQDEPHPALVPALFRGASAHERHLRAQAYHTCLARLRESIGYSRFQRDNLGALLQHYGLKTPWIDLVDNLYTAIWFATNTHKSDASGRSCYVQNSAPFGWLVLVATKFGHEELQTVNLRKQHSSMSVRPQAQHGLSAASQCDGDDCLTFDYAHFVVARIQIPTSARFKLSGLMASTRFLFPPPGIDESFHLLLRPNVNRIVAEVEDQYRLASQSLGRVTQVSYRHPRSRKAPMSADS